MTNSNILSNLVNAISGPNETSFSAYDYLYDNNENNNNNNTSSFFGNGPQHLATILQQLFHKMADNQTTYKTQSNSPLFDSSSSLFPTSLYSFEAVLPPSTSTTNTRFYYILSFLSLWFVLIINPIVVKK